MKIRSGFVSNSSSSSFIVIDNSGKYCSLPFDLDNGLLVVGDNGCCEFGWEETTYDSIYDRINFTYLQTDCGEDFNRLKMLEDVLKQQVKGLTKIIWNISYKYPSKDGKIHGYIDHQSARCEGQNMEMFKSNETLRDFIFGRGSYIQGGNDNN